MKPNAIVLMLWSLYACSSGTDGADGAEGPRGADGADGDRGVEGAQGDDGANGANGANGTHGSLLRIEDEPAGDNCSAGGVAVLAGVDGDGDGVLDDDEVDSTHYVCGGGSSSGGAGAAVGNVAAFEATGVGDHVVLQWQNPVGAFAGVAVRRTTSGFAASPSDGASVYDGTAASVTDSGLTPGTDYFYRAFAYDADGHFASGSDARATALAPGQRDPSFNDAAAVFIPPQEAYSGVFGLAVDGEGRAVMAGFEQGANSGTGRATAWRLHRDGSTDPSFGFAIDSPQSVGVGAVHDQLGRVLLSVGGPRVLRLLPDGSSDVSFGAEGSVDLALAGNAATLALDAQGRILVLTFVGSSSMVLARLSAEGELDATFGTAGSVRVDQLPGGATPYAYGASLAFDGTDILVAGLGYGPTNNYDLAVWRFDDGGDPVLGFSGDGLVTVDGFGDLVAAGNAIAVDSDHGIVVGGYINEGSNYQMALWRFTAAGVLDATFSGDGVVVDRDPAGGTGFGSISDLVLDDEDRIIVVGSDGNAGGGSDAVIARYLPSGELDATFGDSGRIIERGPDGAGDFPESAMRVELDPWGRIVVAGIQGPGATNGVAVWRFVP